MSHYALLNVEPEADEATIRQAIARQSAIWSKRASGATTVEKRHEAERQLGLIAAARQVLLDAERRRAYDASIQSGLALPSAPKPRPKARTSVSSPPTASVGSASRFWVGLVTGGVVVGLATWHVATLRPAPSPPAAVEPSPSSAIALDAEPTAEGPLHAEALRPTPVNLTAQAHASASSVKNEGGLLHVPSRALDGRLGTAWEEGAPGPGQGAWIELRFDQPRHITRVDFMPGYAKYVADAYGDRFYKNARVKVATIQWEGSEVQAFPEDHQAMCSIDLPGNETSFVRLRVDEVRRGVWDDLCISEIEVWGY
jgi:hypothetical protein